MIDISFIVPTLNEAPNISLVVALVDQTVLRLGSPRFEIIFTDDNSNDGTIELVENLSRQRDEIRLIHSPARKGLGHALTLGSNASKGQYILFLDCDVSVSTDDLVRLCEARKPNVMVIGSRYSRASKIVGASWTKVLLSRILNIMLSALFRIGIYDVSHSLRIFSRLDPIDHHILTHPGFFWELTIICKRNGMLITEIPVTFTERKAGVSKNRSFKMLKSVTNAVIYLLMKWWP